MPLVNAVIRVEVDFISSPAQQNDELPPLQACIRMVSVRTGKQIGSETVNADTLLAPGELSGFIAKMIPRHTGALLVEHFKSGKVN